MKLNKTSIFYISLFFLFYLSLVLGFILNEDSAGGAYPDYDFHLNIRDFFLADTWAGFKNYLGTGSTHSPIFIVFLKYLLIFDETFGRFIFLNLCIFIPLIFFKILKEKVNVNIFFIFYLSNFFFLSPYFRSTSIWPGDENLAILFFLISIYFYVLFLKANIEKDKLIYIFFNVLFLAISSYFRPVYAIFTLFYFYEFVLKNIKLNFFLLYTLISIILALPAFYYVFILKVTFFFDSVSNFNLINSIALTYSVLIFYLIPFIFLAKNSLKIIKFNYVNFCFTILFSILVFLFFNYQTETGGGILFMLQNLFFKGNYVFTILFALSFYFCNQYLEINKIKNFILLSILLFFELDGHFYMETYDPLFLICFFLLFDIKIAHNFFNESVLRKINFLFLYLLLFYLGKLTHVYLI